MDLITQTLAEMNLADRPHRECHPLMGGDETFCREELVDAKHRGARRAYIDAFMSFMFGVENFEDDRAWVTKDIFRVYFETGRHRLSNRMVDYLVDERLWELKFHSVPPSNRPKWPFYHVRPEREYGGEQGRNAAFDEYVAARRREDKEKRDRFREEAWSRNFGDGNRFDPPFAGPFRMALPSWMSLKDMGVHKEGLAQIEVVCPFPTFEVEVLEDGERQLKLDMRDMDHGLDLSMAQDKLLFDAWDRVIDWALDLYRCRPLPLNAWMALCDRERALLIENGHPAFLELLCLHKLCVKDPETMGRHCEAFISELDRVRALTLQYVEWGIHCAAVDTLGLMLLLATQEGDELKGKVRVTFAALLWRVAQRRSGLAMRFRGGPEHLMRTASTR